jgi:hypothetical protein
MAVDHIRYDILAQQALRDMVRKVLADVAKTGLKGEHHFNITFTTGDPGVRMPSRLREQYPDEMTIVLQYQFWDLKVGQETFEVGLSFGGVPERLTVPFEAITSFVDPSVPFALQFQTIPEEAEEPSGATTTDVKRKAAKPAGRTRRPARHPSPPASVPAVPPPSALAPAPPSPQPKPSSDKSAVEKPGAEVVRLDRFRKK